MSPGVKDESGQHSEVLRLLSRNFKQMMILMFTLFFPFIDHNLSVVSHFLSFFNIMLYTWVWYWPLFKTELIKSKCYYFQRLILFSQMKCHIDLLKACQVFTYTEWILWLYLDYIFILFWWCLWSCKGSWYDIIFIEMRKDFLLLLMFLRKHFPKRKTR